MNLGIHVKFVEIHFLTMGIIQNVKKCGETWCSNECAEERGLVESHCMLEIDMDDDNEKKIRINCPNLDNCEECVHYVEESCDHCNGVFITDAILLDYVLERLNKTREELTKEYNSFLIKNNNIK